MINKYTTKIILDRVSRMKILDWKTNVAVVYRVVKRDIFDKLPLDIDIKSGEANCADIEREIF